MKFLNLILFLFVSPVIFCQSTIEMPKVAAMTPDAAALARYGEMPVDYSTGVPNISIPLFNIKSQKIDIPVSLSYHAGGIKVQDVATPTGLGWTLSSIGCISFFIAPNGMATTGGPTKAYLDNYAVQNPGLLMADFLRILKTQNLNPERYFFNLGNGKSGVFRKDYVTGEIRQLPYSNCKIEQVSTGFRITDVDGTIFIFDLPFSEDAGFEGIASTIYLTKIISSDLKDTVTISYTRGNSAMNYRGYTLAMEYGPWIEFICDGTGQVEGRSWISQCKPNETFKDIRQPGSYAIPTKLMNISTITTSEAQYNFNYLDDRQDLSKTRLVSIEITDRILNKRVKRIEFEHGYFGSSGANNLRLKLSGIKIFGQSGTLKSEDYQFKYNSMELPPYSTIYNASFQEDYWGYYTGRIGNGPIPEVFLPAIRRGIGSSFREPDHYYAKACMLEEIKYPTGGKTIFEFEPNQSATNIYNYSQESGWENYSNKNVGGFRIKQIRSYHSDNTLAFKKTYDYGAGGIAKEINREMFWMPQRYLFAARTAQWDTPYNSEAFERYRDTYYGNPTSPLSVFNSLPVVYLDVTEYLGDQANNTGKNEYSYSLPRSLSDSYITPPHPYSARDYYLHDRGTEQPLLQSKSRYKNDNGTYALTARTSNVYTTFRQNEFNSGLFLIAPTTYIPYNVSDIDAFIFEEYLFGNIYQYGVNFYYEDARMHEDVDLLTKTYEELDGGTTIKTYSYANLDHLQPTSGTVENSKKEQVITTMKYPADFPGVEPYATMVSRHIWNPVIEKSISKAGIHLSSSKTNYGFWNGNAWAPAADIIVPRSLETKTLDNDYEKRLDYTSYTTDGNIKEAAKEADVPTSYIWGYGGKYAIAVATNAHYEQVFATSFETDDGEFIGSGSSWSSEAVTGKRCMSLSGSAYFLVNKQMPAGTYDFSFWMKGGNVPAVEAGTIVNSSRVLMPNGWYLCSYRVALNGSQVVRIAAGGNSLLIDEIRLLPENAQMQTYTHLPQVGMTSQTDSKGRISYYEYDSLNRLKLVRDQEGNIIKKICYNLAGQVEDCTD
ncbi:hypothetical protein [Filimonas effusa]|uniref:RHS repeat protein n=1 Tax=Filimonas effusa TaxID=2508721 RepID=A0A4V1MAP9_9BACT|nr:hypothetical protein [Filimonas effusa]RXK86636.1 hypothetical protein ESB13_07480 [Filimonas effusa]